MTFKRRRHSSKIQFSLLEGTQQHQSSIREFFSKVPTWRHNSGKCSKISSLSSSTFQLNGRTTRATNGITPPPPFRVAAKRPRHPTYFSTATTATATTTRSPQMNIKTTNKKPRKLQQMYLDLGQRNFGQQTVCRICGMLSVHGVEEDDKEHERICKEVREGVVFSLQRTACRVVADYGSSSSSTLSLSLSLSSPLCDRTNQYRRVIGPSTSSSNRYQHNNNNKNNNTSTANKQGGYIIEVRSTDSYALRQKVAAVMALVDQELGFVQDNHASSGLTSLGDVNNSSTIFKTSKGRPAPIVFLYVYQKRIVGLVSAELTRQAHRLLLVGSNNSSDGGENEGKDHSNQQHEQKHERSKETYRAMIGIHKLWVHDKVRHCHLATRLVDAVRARMVFGMTVPSHLVAFSSPTEAGARFAKKYVQTTSGSTETPVLVYDLPMII